MMTMTSGCRVTTTCTDDITSLQEGYDNSYYALGHDRPPGVVALIHNNSMLHYHHL